MTRYLAPYYCEQSAAAPGAEYKKVMFVLAANHAPLSVGMLKSESTSLPSQTQLKALTCAAAMAPQKYSAENSKWMRVHYRS
jgi:hypothetical protein